MAKLYFDKDVDLSILKDKTIAIIGYGNQGHAWAQNMRDTGLNVIVGNVPDTYAEAAQKAGFSVYSIEEATAKAEIVCMLIPDEVQADVYYSKVHDKLSEGKALVFAHGFNIHYGLIKPSEFIDIIMVAPKGPGETVRQQFLAGYGVPALIAVHQDHTGKAKEIALALAKAIGATRACVIETTFAEETETDLIGEQAVLAGGVPELIKAGFEILVEAGYQPEVVYFEVLNELKLIVDMIYLYGIEGMLKRCSRTAQYGARTRGSRVISKIVRDEIIKIVDEVRSGKFATEWILEQKSGGITLRTLEAIGSKHPIENVGKIIRKYIHKI